MKKFVKMEDKGAEKMNELKIFKKEEFGEIRTLDIDRDPWFEKA